MVPFFARLLLPKRRHASSRTRRLPPPTALAPILPRGFPSKEGTHGPSVVLRSLARLRHRRLIHPKRTTLPRSTAATALVAPAICVPPPAFRRSPTSCTARPPTPASSLEGHGPEEERSRTPVTMTYRAVGTSRARSREPVVCETRRVTFPPEKRKDPAAFTRRLNRDLLLRSRRPLVSGSGTGQSDFIGDGTAGGNYNHFGSGDIPFDSDGFADAVTVHSQFIQVPFVIGGIAFFHSVPASYGEIDLDACLLAKIFNRDITVWNHADIVALNPALASLDQPITVARRVEGSSSTSLITKYLNLKCPTVWTTAMVGKKPCDAETTTSCVNWATDTVEAQGSGEISGYLAANDYSISYIDIGHGLASASARSRSRTPTGNS